MKNLKFLFVVLLVLCISCERDDICAEGTATTPRLIIEFYDASNTDALLSVPRLTVYGDSPDIAIPDADDNSSAILLDDVFDTEQRRVFNLNSNSIKLPLLIDDELGNAFVTTKFVLERDTNLRLDDDNTTNSNIDIIEITYNTEFQYVSRACGYKSIFNNLSVTEDPTDSEPWIGTINVIETTIDNENTVHVQIFH